MPELCRSDFNEMNREERTFLYRVKQVYWQVRKLWSNNNIKIISASHLFYICCSLCRGFHENESMLPSKSFTLRKNNNKMFKKWSKHCGKESDETTQGYQRAGYQRHFIEHSFKKIPYCCMIQLSKFNRLRLSHLKVTSKCFSWIDSKQNNTYYKFRKIFTVKYIPFQLVSGQWKSITNKYLFMSVFKNNNKVLLI